MEQSNLVLITPPDPVGQSVDRILSAGIGVVIPTKWSPPWKKATIYGRELPAMETLYAASVAEKAGAKVTLLDIGLEGWHDEDAVAKTLASLPKLDPDTPLWLGLRINMPTVLGDLAFSKTLKASRPDARVFIYGSLIMTTLDHWVDEAKEVDGIIFGEVEEVIGDIFKANGPDRWKSVQGVIDPKKYSPVDASKLYDSSVVMKFDKWVRVKELGDLPHPAWHLVPFDRYSETGNPADCGAHVQASRGCPIGCTMCPYMVHEGRPFRANPVDRVVYDLKYLNDHYGITKVRFRDPNFGFDKRFMKDLAEKMIESGVKIDGAAELSLEMLTHEQIDLLNKAGIRTILTGIESNDETCLASIGQKIKINEFLAEKIAYCRSIGTDVYGSFIVGAPEESWDTLTRTVNYAKNIDAQCAATIMTPFPGTPIFYRAIEEGLMKPQMRYDEWNSYAPTMRSYYLTCDELKAARLWFRVETLIPYKLRRAKAEQGTAGVIKTAIKLTPHAIVRAALRVYVWFKRNVITTKPLLPETNSTSRAASLENRRQQWLDQS